MRTIFFAVLMGACASEEPGDEAAATSSTGLEATGESSDVSSSTTMAAETGDPSSSSSTAAEDATSSEASSGNASTTTGPTSGPGVLPGETGLEAFCRRYFECGGSTYADPQACIDAAYDYWGECPTRAAALDAFGACMSVIECTDWTPDAYNPASTPCAAEWEDLGASDPCG